VPEARVKIEGSRLAETGPLLITHWGFSGPAVLRLSAWGARELAAAGYRFGMAVNWLGGMGEQEVRVRLQELRYDLAARKMATGSPLGLPQRLWEYWLGISGIDMARRWADMSTREQNRLAGLLCGATFTVHGKTTFKEEFVTAGGVRLAEVDPSTMQSRRVNGLFFAGEILDVDGVTGGFNFQHAWTSGWIVADTIVNI
jgi:predicted Rossmann fold flavoprotein